MLDILANFHWSDTDKQVLGAIMGALLGAVIGATSTFYVSDHTRRKQIELGEIEKIRQKIKNSTGAMAAIENNLHNLLVMSLKNTGHFRDVTKGVYDSKTGNAVFTMSLPQLYQVEPRLSDDILNVGLGIQWTALELEVILHNSNIREFTNYYAFLRTSVHSAQLTNPNSLVIKTLLSDSATIASGAKGEMLACDNFKSRCITVLALLRLQLTQYRKIDYSKSINLKGLEDYQKKLIDYKPSEDELNEKIQELEQDYTEEKAFGGNVKF